MMDEQRVSGIDVLEMLPCLVQHAPQLALLQRYRLIVVRLDVDAQEIDLDRLGLIDLDGDLDVGNGGIEAEVGVVGVQYGGSFRKDVDDLLSQDQRGVVYDWTWFDVSFADCGFAVEEEG